MKLEILKFTWMCTNVINLTDFHIFINFEVRRSITRPLTFTVTQPPVKVALGNKDIQNDFNYVRVHDLSSDAVRTAFGRIVFAEIILE